MLPPARPACLSSILTAAKLRRASRSAEPARQVPEPRQVREGRRVQEPRRVRKPRRVREAHRKNLQLRRTPPRSNSAFITLARPPASSRIQTKLPASWALKAGSFNTSRTEKLFLRPSPPRSRRLPRTCFLG